MKHCQGLGESVQIRSTLRGNTFGEYFGSSLASIDLNNDGYDDLIIGAPLFSRRDFDEGKIYVYLGSGKVRNYEVFMILHLI